MFTDHSGLGSGGPVPEEARFQVGLACSDVRKEVGAMDLRVHQTVVGK